MKARRGTKSNPFEIGETVRFRNSNITGVVKKRSGSEICYLSAKRKWTPIMYLIFVEKINMELWYPSRDLEALNNKQKRG